MIYNQYGQSIGIFTGYRIVYGTIVIYDYTRLSWGLDSISLKCLYQFYTWK